VAQDAKLRSFGTSDSNVSSAVAATPE